MATSDRTTYHITPANMGGWNLRKEGENQSLSTHNPKSEAREEAHYLAERDRPSILVIHREDGRTEHHNIYD